VEDDTMDQSEPREPRSGRSAPPDHDEERSERALAVGPSLRELDATPARRRGRHEAPRSFGDPVAPATIVVALVLVVVAGVLATRLIGSAEPSPQSAAPTTSPATAGGPTSQLPGSGAYGNLVSNWSFEQDLAGWRVVGPADAGREPQGRTSGSCATVRAGGSQPEQIGLALPGVVQAAGKGHRYVASAWVRSTAPGMRVTLRLVGSGGEPERSQASTTTLPGVRWRRVFVDHTVAADGANLDLEVTAQAVPPGDALLLDEVVVRQG
jgi:Carbohydrate binding domain